MGDLVVGLAKTVVEGLITKAQTAIDEDTWLRNSARTNLRFITSEFELMQSFLDAADDERAKNKVVMTWVRQIRELASDLEDGIEFVVHLDMEHTWWRRMLPPCVAGALPLDEAVSEIQELRDRVEELSGRNKRYNIIADAGSRAQQPAAPHPAGSQRQLGVQDLSRLISNKGRDLQVISVLWTGGDDFGMATLIREAYNDPAVCQDFACRAWVKLTHTAFDPRDFITCLMAQFYANSPEEQDEAAIIGVHVLTKMEASQYDLLEEFVKKMENKYLVVLEDLPTMVVWDAIRTLLPDRNNGSRIIMSTQQSEIAELCAGHPCQVAELNKFSAHHSVYAYFKQGSQDDKPGVRHTSPSAACEWMMEESPLGRESEISELRQYITDSKPVQVMPVWGIAGVGKSTLVRHLYYTLLSEKQFDKFAWVDISHPFKLPDLCRRLLLDMHPEDVSIKDCGQLLVQNRCLIVIDGLRSMKEWDLIKSDLLVSGSSKSVIIIITTEESIARHCNEELMFNVKGLEADAAFKLFLKKVSVENSIPPSFSGQEAAELRELILKCGGLPKILVAISGLLTTKTATWMETACSINDKFMHHLETNPAFAGLQGLFDRMHATLRDSPDSLKPYIFYLSIFPRDRSIRRRRLVRRWIAEGYSTESNDRNAEENGELFFSKLLKMGIIHQPPQLVTTAFTDTDTRMVSCQVDGFYREYIISRRTDENLVCELRDSSSTSTKCTGRHLIIRESWDRHPDVFKSMDFRRLRSMTVFGMWAPFFISESMMHFRALDLENASGVSDVDLEQIVKMLPRLKFLSLRGCRQVSRLTNALGALRQLQTLDVRHTSIVALPLSIIRLDKLQYIRAGSTIPADESSAEHLSVSRWRRPPVGVNAPNGIGKLIDLHTLGVVNIGASGSKVILKELNKLTQLHKLGVSGINRKNSDKFFSAISGHARLESLSVQLEKDSQSCLDDITLPLDNLHSLKLYGLADKLPKWSDRLTKLTKLDLEMETLRTDDIRFFADKDDMRLLGELPKLCILRLHIKQQQDGKLHFCVIINGDECPSYENVKILEIACSSRLHVAFGSKTMKHLELLKVDCCSGASLQFDGLPNLSELKEIFLKGSYDETLKQHLKNQLADHPKKNLLKHHEESNF